MKKLFTSKKFIFTTLSRLSPDSWPSASSDAAGKQEAISDDRTVNVRKYLIFC